MKYLTIAIALFLSACVTSGAKGPISYEAVGDEGYRNFTLRWTGTSAGTETDVYYRIYNDTGYVRVCAFYVISGSGMADIMTRAWLDNAFFELHGEKILSARFLNPEPEFYNSKAACVTTTTEFKKFIASGFALRGSKVTVSF